MKTFTEYLIESQKRYDFKIKIAGEMTTEQENVLKTSLERFVTNSFKKAGKTPIQELPLDFPNVKNVEVNIYEVSLDYPTTQHELTEVVSQALKKHASYVVVKRPGEPSEEYQTPAPERKGALLDDPNYSESPNAKFEDYYGDKYNTGFVKELNDILRLQRKERGEQRPTEGDAKFNTDSPAGTQSPIKPTDYNPLRK
ncbi:MAG: hypothetical protein EBX47_08000 [Synechococcaceae bacterium WB8_1B_057]|nr:hypothetical protein [Synechococcaceae bacterium WB8_1B_057]